MKKSLIVFFVSLFCFPVMPEFIIGHYPIREIGKPIGEDPIKEIGSPLGHKDSHRNTARKKHNSAHNHKHIGNE